MSSLKGLNVMLLWNYCSGLTRHTVKDYGQARDRETSQRWATLQRASRTSDDTITRIPKKPPVLAPDYDAVVAAIENYVAAYGEEHMLKAAIMDGRIKGQRKLEDIEKRNARRAAIGERFNLAR